MRWSTVVLLLVFAACSQAQELAPTTSSEPILTTTTEQPVPTSTEPPPTTTSTSSTSTTTTTTIPVLQSLSYEELETPGFPTHLIPWLGDGGELLATKAGRVIAMSDGVLGEVVLDINERVINSGERGLLALAVSEGGDLLYVHYSGSNSNTVVSEFRLVDGAFDPDSERVLFQLRQPASNHNGGMIQFGPDGRLYLALGDGGRSNDVFGNGQNQETLFGGIVAIDVDTTEAELFQYGLRNPWRFWIDSNTIYVADVGQRRYEEISVAPLEPDVNYGWPITEGLHCFRPASECDMSGLTLPVIEISHSDSGTCSITGGVVYRGMAIPELNGVYLYSDFCGGYLRGLVDGEVTDYTDQVGDAGKVVSFGTDSDGEVYVLTTDSLLKLVPDRG